jgi:hypothetical protein
MIFEFPEAITNPLIEARGIANLQVLLHAAIR